MIDATPTLTFDSRALARQAWTFRWQVELDAALRFGRLGLRLRELDTPPNLLAAVQQAAEDERRHALHCEAISRAYGNDKPAPTPVLEEIVPAGLALPLQMLYEVASSCVTETVSVAVLVSLVHAAPQGVLMPVLRELLTDEIRHGKMGWAYLTHVHRRRSVRFVAEWLPFMLEGTAAEELSRPARGAEEADELLQHGVLPWSMKRSIFVRTLELVVFPGLEHLDIDTRPAREWLEHRLSSGGLS